ATSGSSLSVEAIIARFIATVTSATGGEKPALIRTLSHEVCGYNLIRRVRGNAIVLLDETLSRDVFRRAILDAGCAGTRQARRDAPMWVIGFLRDHRTCGDNVDGSL